jgi:hypothetical protein
MYRDIFNAIDDEFTPLRITAIGALQATKRTLILPMTQRA